MPDSEQDQERIKRFKMGEVIKAKISRPRNYNHHKKLFGLVRLIAENSEVYDNDRKALTALKLASGHCSYLADPTTGEIVPQPDSISYESMDQTDFEKWYEDAVNGALKYIVPTMTRMAIDQAVNEVVRF
jgi:NAD(P)H-hydrate repair Nnr-like enzyme with NAD(P)H-hydrate dehydratase domain